MKSGALACGAGGVWICALLFAPNEVRLAPGLPESWDVQGLILLGWAEKKLRKSDHLDNGRKNALFDRNPIPVGSADFFDLKFAESPAFERCLTFNYSFG